MKTVAALLLGVLLMACQTPPVPTTPPIQERVLQPSPTGSYQEGEVVGVNILCNDESNILAFARADMISDAMGNAVLRMLINKGVCRQTATAIGVMLVHLVLEYTDYNGDKSEIWRIKSSPKNWFIAIYAKKKVAPTST